MFGKFKSKNNGGTPFWLRWAVIGVLAYMFFVSYQNRGREDVERRASYNSNHGEIVRSTPGDSITIAGNRVVSEKQKANIQIGGNIEGRGATASCGETADVSVETLLPDGLVLNEAQQAKYVAPENKTVRVGLHNADALWAAGITGMRTGGVREVLVPAIKLFGEDLTQELALSRQAMMRYKITLNDLNPKHPDGTLPFRAMDSAIGHGRIASCGYKAKILLTIWNAKGEKTHVSTTPETLTIGESRLGHGIDRGILGMKAKGERTLTIPPAYQGMERSKIKQTFDFQEKLSTEEVITVDVTLVSVEKP